MNHLKIALTILFVLGSQSVMANTLVCKRNISTSAVRTVVLGSIFMVCESPAAVNMNKPGMKEKYCAGAGLATTGFSRSGNARSLSGVTALSALNGMPEGVSVQFAYSELADGSLEGQLNLSSGALSPAIGLNLPLHTSGYSCVQR